MFALQPWVKVLGPYNISFVKAPELNQVIDTERKKTWFIKGIHSAVRCSRSSGVEHVVHRLQQL